MQNSKRKNHYKLQVTGYRLRAQSGFTLIELLISLAVIAILSGAVLQVARFSDTHKSLTLATDEFRAALRTAQSSALSIPNPMDRHVCGFGVSIIDAADPDPDNQYEVFYTWVDDATFIDDPNTCKNDASYRDGSGHDELVSRGSLPDGLVFQGHAGETVFFGAPYGEAYGNDGSLLDADLTYTIENTNVGVTRDVVVSPMGKIE